MTTTSVKDGYELKRVVLTTPKRLFEAWLDDVEHSDMTGSRATISAEVGGAFSMLDGAVAGRIVELEPYSRIVHELNTNGPARLEVSLATGSNYGGLGNPQDDGTTIILRHTMAAQGQTELSPDWWEDRYFRPMDAHFATGNNRFTRPQG